jgi:RimJ/RimL family protein N-acetyltransferase
VIDIALREVVEDDLPTLFAHQIDPAAHRMAGFKPRDHDAFMEHWHVKILGDPTVEKRAIVYAGEVVGHIGCFDRDGKREIGYWIAREHWGKGIATEAVSRFLAQVAERPLYAGVAKHNLASLRVLEKCGFTIVEEEEPDGVLLVLEGRAG